MALTFLLVSSVSVALGPGVLGTPANTFPDILLPGFHDPPQKAYFAKEDTRFYKVSPLNGPSDVWEARAFDAEDDIVFWEIDWTDRPGVQVPPGMHISVPSPPVRASDSYLRIHWSPDYDDAGTYHFRMDLSDGRVIDRVEFQIIVENTNRRPSIDPVSPRTVLEGQTLEVILHGRDEDRSDPTYPDTVVYMPTQVPPGAQLQDGHGGVATFRWTPGHHQAGTYTVTATLNDYDANGLVPGGPERPDTPLDPVTDSEYVDPPVRPVEPFEYNATVTFHITVIDVNIAPTCLPLAPEEIRYGLPLAVHLHCEDIDGDPITLTAPGLPTGSTFSDFGGGEGRFDWTATKTQVGHHTVHFQAAAGAHTTQAALAITIHLLDSPPVIFPLRPFPLYETAHLRLPIHARDADGDPITLRAQGLPAGATFVDLGNGEGQFDWTPAIGSVGGYSVRFIAEAHGVVRFRDHPIQVLPSHSFKVEPLGGLVQSGAPGTTHLLPVRITNTGFLADTYHFRTYIANVAGHGWTLDTPSDLPLGPGDSQVLQLHVDIPANGIQSRPRLITESVERGFTTMTTWTLDVPVLLAVRPDLDVLNVTEGTLVDAALQGVTGQVEARWIDGRPASGLHVVLRQEPVPLAELWSEQSGITDADGVMPFIFHPDPLALLPGRHDLIATAWRGERTDIGLGEYLVLVL